MLAAGLVAALFSASAGPKPAQKGDVVRLIKAKSVQIITSEDDRAFRKAVEATFLHNDTYLICDTAIWRVADNIINAKGHVKLMQEGTVLTSETLDYYVDRDLEITHDNDDQGDHGTHVSGIATANYYVPNSAAEENHTAGSL